MSVLRCLSIFALVLLFICTASVFAAKSSWSTTSYYILGISKFWFAYAEAEATNINDSGWFHVWAHCGTGGRDYKGGNYQGIMQKWAFSLEITSIGGNQPSPYWASDFIN